MNRLFSLLLIFLGVILLVVPPSLAQEHGPVVLVNITDEIDQTTATTFSNALAYARQHQAQALVMLLNTPGGGLQQTFDIEEEIRSFFSRHIGAAEGGQQQTLDEQ